MRRLITDKIAGEFYDSPAEFMRINLAREKLPQNVCNDSDDPLNPAFKNKTSRRIEWTGYKDGRDLLRQFENCDIKNAKLDEIKKEFKTLTQMKAKTQFRADIVGAVPIVPNYLAGVPESMLNIRKINVKSKIVNVYVEVGVSCNYSAESMEKQGAIVMSHILALERQGYRQNIFAISGHYWKGTVDFLCVKLKDAKQRMNIQRVMYPIVNPSFLRGIVFGWFVRCPDLAHYDSGKGYPLCSRRTDEIIQKICGKNGIYIAVQDAIGDENQPQKAINEFTMGTNKRKAIV